MKKPGESRMKKTYLLLLSLLIGLQICLTRANEIDNLARALKEIVEDPISLITQTPTDLTTLTFANLMQETFWPLKDALNDSQFEQAVKVAKLDNKISEDYIKNFNTFLSKLENERETFLLGLFGVSQIDNLPGLLNDTNDSRNHGRTSKETIEDLIKIKNKEDKIKIDNYLILQLLVSVLASRRMITSINQNSLLNHIIPNLNLNCELAKLYNSSTLAPAALIFGAFYYIAQFETYRKALKEDALDVICDPINTEKNPDYPPIDDPNDDQNIRNDKEKKRQEFSKISDTLTQKLKEIVNLAHPIVLTELINPWLEKKIDAVEAKYLLKLNNVTDPNLINDLLIKAGKEFDRLNDYAASEKPIGIKQKTALKKIKDQAQKLNDGVAQGTIDIAKKIDTAKKEFEKHLELNQLGKYATAITNEINNIEPANRLLEAFRKKQLLELTISLNKQKKELERRRDNWEILRNLIIDDLWQKLPCDSSIKQTASLETFRKDLHTKLENLTNKSVSTPVLKNFENKKLGGVFYLYWPAKISNIETQYNLFYTALTEELKKAGSAALKKNVAPCFTFFACFEPLLIAEKSETLLASLSSTDIKAVIGDTIKYYAKLLCSEKANKAEVNFKEIAKKLLDALYQITLLQGDFIIPALQNGIKYCEDPTANNTEKQKCIDSVQNLLDTSNKA